MTKAQYLPCGRQTAFESSNDHGVRVYDFVENRKWIFARNQGEYAGWGGDFGVIVQQGLIASADPDEIRFWKVPSSE